jgi:hypothetical protein
MKCIMGWKRLSACFNSRTAGWIRMKFGWVLCQGGLPPNRTVEYPEIGGSKTVDEKVVRCDPNVVQSRGQSRKHLHHF